MHRKFTRHGESISLADFRDIAVPTLSERLEVYHNWQASRRRDGTWPYDKTLLGPLLPDSTTADGCGRGSDGPDYCSQDSLSLASHRCVRQAAIEAIAEFGVHSAGASALIGNTPISRELEAELAQFVGYEHALLSPTGWAAGYGAVKGLVRPGDWVVLDARSQPCLQEGARAATPNVASVPDNEALKRRLARIRAGHPRAFILAITETVFAANSRAADLGEFLDICRRYGAVSLVGVARDLGCVGADGLGQLELQNAVGGPDLLVGSFSRTFASNGGFVATNEGAVASYLRLYAGPLTFSHALSPIQVAIVRAALGIVKSGEGARRREQLAENSRYLRWQLAHNGFACLGEPAATVPVFLGEDEPARAFWRTLSNRGVASNLIEFPAVAANRARIMIEVQSAHTKAHADRFVTELVAAREGILEPAAALLGCPHRPPFAFAHA